MSEDPSTGEGVSITPDLDGVWSVTLDERGAAEVYVDTHPRRGDTERLRIVSLTLDAGAGRVRARLTPPEARLLAEELAAAATAADGHEQRTCNND